MVEYLDRITPGVDLEIAKTLQKSLTKQGFKLELGKKVTSAVADKKGVKLTYEPAAGGDATEMNVDVVLVAVGRRPYTTGLGLETIGVEKDARGFVPNHHWKTNVDGVYAVSYTHLDVYKRQALGASLKGGDVSINKEAVSYTHLDVYKRQLSRCVTDSKTLSLTCPIRALCFFACSISSRTCGRLATFLENKSPYNLAPHSIPSRTWRAPSARKSMVSWRAFFLSKDLASFTRLFWALVISVISWFM